MAATDLAKDLKNVSEKDRKQIEQAQEMMGPDPETMGFMKNLFWGNFRDDLLFPYPEVPADEVAKCDQLLAELDAYLENEHPAMQIDRDQEIPKDSLQRLFDIGVLGMTIPREYGGLGLGITSYNRVLERIGRSCGSTAVVVSAHQSIGCKAVMLFGTEEQKQRFLPRMATDTLSAFCLSEPNVGCDAGGQETRCERSEDGEYYILNGEKKWATSGSLSGLFTVMAKQRIKDPKTGEEKDKVTALICTPDMEGVDIYSRNRSKCGIRGTWQARIRLKDVKVPKENLLHQEGRGLNVALTCLNYGRCTLSAGMVGAARFSLEQGGKWAKNRFQFDRPIGEFELVQNKLADMAAFVSARDAMLYMTTGFLDRHDEDIMLETAACKVFCSEWGFRTVNECLQIMGGESYMTENRVERMWRDSRINTIVEGANEVMHSFIFAYGSKQLGEWMLSVKNNPLKNVGAGMKIASQLFLGLRPAAPRTDRCHPRARHLVEQLMLRIREFSHQVKMMFKEHEESLITNQLVQERLSLAALWVHATSCALSRFDANLRNGLDGAALEHEAAVVEHLCAHADSEFSAAIRSLRSNHDATVRKAGESVLKWVDTLPNEKYSLPEKSPNADARGRDGHGFHANQDEIKQFGSGTVFTGNTV
ncbi:MAG: acyl-CoA dehydrogenase family protein [Planctomycetota bacterium]|nr:acyl-CoA dehydrogenase family protein [Planctomycetota bacterium]